MLDLRLITPPLGAPVALDIARQHVRVGHMQEDILLEAFIAAATQAVQDSTGRALMPQVWEYRMRCSLSGWLRIPVAPLLSVDSITAAGVVLDTEDYAVDAPSGPTCGRGQIYFGGSGGCGLAGSADPAPATTIRFTAGYQTEDHVPAPLVSAILLLVGSLYENREAESERSGAAARILNTNPAYERLLAPYRLIG
jgi:uncharacterized phiE125 gp8 family phage protein